MSKETNASKMEKLVKAYLLSGQSQKAFAAAHGVSENKMYYWIKKLSNTNSSTSKKESSKTDFVPISVTPINIPKGVIVIRCISGVEIEIPV